MTKEQKIAAFDPNGIGLTNANIFGLPFDYDDSEVIIIPVPWDLTVSNLSGTAYGPQAIFDYSSQIDLFDFDFKDAWKKGFYFSEIPNIFLEKNIQLKPKAERYISFLENGGNVSENKIFLSIQKELNEACKELYLYILEISEKVLKDGKTPIILGGEHSTPLGLMCAIDKTLNNNWGILQIDAHADLRPAYEGFIYSHASIMYNAINNCQNLSKLVSVSVRDLCEQEFRFAETSKGKIIPFYWNELVKNRFGQNKEVLNWDKQCDLIIEQLPNNVYISFDIDGLEPGLCPETGTPVAGGLQLEEAFHLIRKVVSSGRKIIGADLCEVAVGDFPIKDNSKEYNANVGARVLYKLCNAVVYSN